MKPGWFQWVMPGKITFSKSDKIASTGSPCSGGAVGIWLLGIDYALPLLVFFYMLVEGGESWISTLIMTAGTYGLIWGLFEYILEMRWPPGVLFGY